MHPLHNFFLKWGRGEEHLRSLQRAFKEFGNSDFYEVSTELDYKGRPVARTRNVTRPDPELSLVIGDCVHNFRSALDNLAYVLATANTVPFPDSYTGTTAFPIFETGPKFRERGRAGATYKMRGMSRSAIASVQRLQPYHRRKHPELWALWMLKELSDIDKHRLLHLTAWIPRSVQVKLSGLRVAGGNVEVKHFARPMEEGTLFAQVIGDFIAPAEVNVDAKITPDVIFDKRTEARSVRGKSVLNTLASIRDLIASRVISEFENEFRRLFPELKRVRVIRRRRSPN